MHIETPLSIALDDYAAQCAVGNLSNVHIEPTPQGASLALKFTADTWWEEAEYALTMWVGKGAPSTDGESAGWVKVRDLSIDLGAEHLEDSLSTVVPMPSVPHVIESIDQLLALMSAAVGAIVCADTEEDLTAVMAELTRLSGGARSAAELAKAREKARGDLMWNCTMDLLGGITITEAESPHLSFDVAAVTMDPTTQQKANLRVGWIPARENARQYTHSYQIGDDACYAHDDADIDRLMALVPDDSREHYLHVFDHLHQIAHAASDYADALAGEAIAQASTTDRPLDAFERHDLIHEVHKEALVIMNPVAWTLSGEPGLPHHDH
ncbi:MAG TPA: hypothetical protein VF885_00475 [Arthrobacter sp.]